MYSLANLLYSIQLDLYSHKLLQHCFYDLQQSLLIMKPCLDLRCERRTLPHWLYSDTTQMHILNCLLTDSYCKQLCILVCSYEKHQNQKRRKFVGWCFIVIEFRDKESGMDSQ